MKYYISDLMDYIRDDSVALEAQTNVSADRIKELTMKKVHDASKQTGRSVRRVLRTFLVAAALIALLSVTVYAAEEISGVSAVELFKGYFGWNLTESQKGAIEELSMIQAPTADNTGTEGRSYLPQAVTTDGVTITPMTAIATGNGFVLRLRIEVPEGETLSIPDPETGHLQLFSIREGYPEGEEEVPPLTNEKGESIFSGTWTSEWFDEVPDDNAVETVVRFNGQMTNFSKLGGQTVTLNIPHIWMQSVNGYSVLYHGPWNFDISIPATDDEIQLRVAPDMTTLSSNGGEVTLESVSINRLSVEMKWTFPEWGEYDEDGNWNTPWGEPWPEPEGEICLVLKDGSKVEWGGGGFSSCGPTFATNEIYFAVPINYEDLDYFVFGDLKVPIDIA